MSYSIVECDVYHIRAHYWYNKKENHTHLMKRFRSSIINVFIAIKLEIRIRPSRHALSLDPLWHLVQFHSLEDE